ncbi:hypothetical protein KCG44_07345 [Pacificimonas sp. WHA3]|uniref:Uncharacterized protein n=1 Tax=Pacificimonas pallii TaxID=2827236 RepID=A0ABS6SDV2_9SPHN|nr:hypothetical protein [Pacificimonas pallii]MBV7256599.1 hypothetical protein [Pacificimonas pallii]
MSWYRIRLEMGRTRENPEGSPSHAYMLTLPLNAEGRVDAATYEKAPARASILHMSPEDGEESGRLILRADGKWAFSYEPGDEDDETIFALATHAIETGNYITVTEPDGDQVPYKIVSVRELMAVKS